MKSEPTEEKLWQRQVAEWRKGKDQFFAESSNTPLPSQERQRFRGLSYYEVDPRWKVRARFRRLPPGKPVELAASRGTHPLMYVSYAQAELKLPTGEAERVTLFAQQHDHEGHVPHEPHELFLPFRDATSGRETYGAGRYLEIPNPLENDRGEVEGDIDFNFAYSPFCAYNDDYVCPLPPRKNWMKANVRAGERLAKPE